ncbi:MAG: hypothetical protein KatS3mg115_0323 [Candidatus Poribacteria bacterium]|nr:MAG: hypothetical protein KatS3mg115_0323 [Candidatus Poribacteria bacterium]
MTTLKRTSSRTAPVRGLASSASGRGRLMHRVVITGMGVISPIGSTLEEFWANVVAGKSGIGPVTRFDTSLFRTQIAAEVKHFEPERYVDPQRRPATGPSYPLCPGRLADGHGGRRPEAWGLRPQPSRGGHRLGGSGGSRSSRNNTRSSWRKVRDGSAPSLSPMRSLTWPRGGSRSTFDLRGPNLATVTACASSNHAIGDAFYLLQARRGRPDAGGG